MSCHFRRPARLYNWDALRRSPDAGSKAQALLKRHAPALHTTLSGGFTASASDRLEWSGGPQSTVLCAGTSTLMKVLTWQLERPFEADEIMLHQV
jgi:hypothetical protein